MLSRCGDSLLTLSPVYCDVIARVRKTLLETILEKFVTENKFRAENITDDKFVTENKFRAENITDDKVWDRE